MKIQKKIKIIILFFVFLLILSGCTKKKIEDVDYNNGVSHLEKYEYSSALQDFKNSINSNPSNTNSYIQAVSILKKKKNYDDALVILNNGKDFASDSKRIYEAIGEIYLLKNDYANAQDNFSKAIEKDSSYLEAYKGLTESLLLTGKVDDAKKKLEDFKSGNKDDFVEVKYLLASLQSTDVEVAKNTIESLTINVSDYPKIEKLNNALLKTEESEENSSIEDYMSVAYTILESNDYPYVLPLLDKVIAENEYYYGGHLYKGFVFLKLGEFENAKTSLDKALALDSKNVDVLKFLAQTYAGLGDKTNAISTYNSIVGLAPKDVDVRKGYIDALLSFSMVNEAKVQANDLVSFDSSIESRVILSNILAQLEDYSAISQQLKDIAKDEEYSGSSDELKSKALSLSGIAKYQLGDKATGVKELEDSISISSSNAEAHFHLGVVYSETGEPVNAKKEFEKAIDLDFEGTISGRAMQYLEDLD